MIGKLDSLSYSMDGALIISVSVPRVHAQELQLLVGQPVDVEIRKQRKKRSLSANSLAWALCHEIGLAMRLPKEDIYRKAIREVGCWDEVEVAEYAATALMERWKRQGTGWVTEDMGPGAPGMRTIFLYYGSSTYSTQEMSRLIDYLVDDAKQLEIVMPATEAQMEEAKRRWGNDA